MTTSAGLPTVKVLLRGPVDLMRPNGRPIRVEMVCHADVPHDVDGSLRPFARFRRHGEERERSFLALGDALMTERPQAWEEGSRSWQPPAHLVPAHGAVFSPFEYLRESGPSVKHQVTGTFDFQTLDLRIFAVEGQPLDGFLLEGDPSNLARIQAQLARLRAAAATAILLRPEGFFVARHMPRWQISQNFRIRNGARLELLDASPRPEEWSFRLDRIAEALEALRAGPFEQWSVSGDLIQFAADRAPSLEDDVVRLARERAPDLAVSRSLSPDRLSAQLVFAHHDLTNAARIIAEEGRPGVERVLQAALQMLGHRMDFEGEAACWSPLRDRLLQEGIHPAASAQAREARP